MRIERYLPLTVVPVVGASGCTSGLAESEAYRVVSAYADHLVGRIWLLLAALLDLVRGMGGGIAAVLGLFFVGILAGGAWWMQRRLNRQIAGGPEPVWSVVKQELLFSVPGLFAFLIALPYLVGRALVLMAGSFLGDLFGVDEAEGEEDESTPMVTATLGPSFFGAGFVVFALYLVSLGLEPLLRAQYGLSPGYPPWQYVFLGHSPHLAWYLPLDRFPALLTLGSVLFWGVVWWWSGRVIRLLYAGELGRNLADDRDDDATLRPWREWFAVPELASPASSYVAWAGWVVAAAGLLLLATWVTTSTAPYRMDPSLASVSFFLWLGWGLHLLLSGRFELSEQEEEETEEVEAETVGWPDVVEDLGERWELEEPEPVREPRRVVPLAPPTEGEGSGRAISPMLEELVPGESGLTTMQREVLTSLSLQGFVHTEPPVDRAELAMSDTAESGFESDDRMRHGNQVVLAPEDSGKSTLAMLAAANEQLVHTRNSLLVARDAERAERLWRRFRESVDRSTLRWNLRCRLAGEDLVDDATRDIVPDVVVTSLETLTVDILGAPSNHRAFLENLGLVVVDDVESFCGPVELHAQLAFRRLALRLREAIGVDQLGEERSPRALVLGTESMENTPMWARSLLGADAVARRYGAGDGGGGDEESPDRHQHHFRLRDFRDVSGELVGFQELVKSCERLGVPWHYRPAGDARRDVGRQGLNLREEPQHDVDAPAEAGVVFVEGHVSDVRRELDRLARAGAEYDPVEAAGGAPEEAAPPDEIAIGVVQIVDRDEGTAFTELDASSPLADTIESLPRPVVHPPVGDVTEAHLAAELTENWVETADVLDVFGNETARVLDRLARSGFLKTDERTDVHEERAEFEEELYVRAPAMAVGADEDDGDGPRLPPRVNQVELPTGDRVAIRNRTTLDPIDEVDAEAAHFVYYPGRIFENAKGRFVVVGTVDEQEDELDQTGPLAGRDILAEPFLEDERSSPRRRTRVERGGESAAGDESESEGSAGRGIEPIFIGDEPVGVGLEPVDVRYRHLATYRLDPDGGEVRQRVVRPGSAEWRGFETTALAVTPNPSIVEERETDVPELTLRGARVVAAALRAVLPVVYRGGDDRTAVLLHVDAEEPELDRTLQPGEGFYLCDPHAGGRGTAMAIRRDGVELLLRFCRLYLERVLSLDRLLGKHDHWVTPEKLRSASELLATPDAELRDEVLRWLDTRLRPERGGDVPVAGSGAEGPEGVGREAGEGDPFDVGRCWYSPEEAPEDLVWVKHRWRLPEFGDRGWPEATVDVGLERQTVSTLSTPGNATVGAFREELTDQLEGPSPTTAPVRRIRLGDGGGAEASEEGDAGESSPPEVGDRAVSMVARVAAVLAPLAPLASILEEEIDTSGAAEGSPPSMAKFRRAARVVRFVQGIPGTRAKEDDDATATAIGALVRRRATGAARAVLAAALLELSGFSTGFFLAKDGEGLEVGADLPGRPDGEWPGGDRVVAGWHSTIESRADAAVFSETSGGQEAEGRGPRVFVPVSTAPDTPVEIPPFEDVENWVFAEVPRVGVFDDIRE